MKAELRACDFCWNDGSKIVLAKSSYTVPTRHPGDDGRVDVCARHTKGAAEVGIALREIEEPELPYW